MLKITLTTCLLFFTGFAICHSQEIEALRQKIDSIIDTKKAIVGVAINGTKVNDSLSINGHRNFPM